MLHTLIFSYWKSATFSELTGSRLQMEHLFVVLLPELPCLFFLTIHQQWITPMEEALVDDLELLSFGAFGFLLLISSGWIDFYQLSVWSLLTCTFLFRLVNVCSFAFGIVSWNLVLAGCDSSRSSRNISYAFSQTALTASKSCCIFGGVTFPMERNTRSCCTLLNGSSQWL